ncbi:MULTISPECIES: toll/interleukin-1 receptor domain-containing protein [Kordiimonas]|uniref:toll/interleukin-1 receptor domain-containing protein n=1 Tax=Kordiimonas TaxID=288021 RepID=UPI00257CFEE6|nr:toll/interleukin-1 receptor domain-containing protein [Kordiimonas sp. UBA4487]
MTEHTTYTAFVSYSHKDDKWARWLLKALEAYRVPRHLVGTEGGNGTVPAKLTRIFRDREELAAGAHLDAKIQEALEQSQTLLVVCSPNAVHSYGVNQEIELFRQMRGDEHIFYIIKDGEPHAEARGFDPDLECFPKALLDHSLETTTAYGVPLAADARAKGDGKKMALLKVIAGILGVNLDTLVRRDLQRRQRRLWGFMVAATAGMMLTTALATQAYLASKTAEEALEHAQRQQDEAESLISYIADDLGRQLWRRGHVDILEAMSSRILDHYDGQNSPDMGPKEIARKVRGLAMLARSQLFKGDTSVLGDRIAELRTVTLEVMQKHPVDTTVLQTHLNTLKLLSDIRLTDGRYEEARSLIEERISTAERLYSLEPERHPDDRMEIGNALIDLAWVYAHPFQRTDEAYEMIKKGLAIRIAVGLLPRNVDSYYRLQNVAGGYHHLSSIQEITEPLAVSIASRQKCLDTYLERQQLSPNQLIYQMLRFRFHNEMAELLLHAGRIPEAKDFLNKGQTNLKKLLENDPENYRYLVMVGRADLIRGQILMVEGEWQKAQAALSKALDLLDAQHKNSVETLDATNWLMTAETLHALAQANQGNLADAETSLVQVEGDIHSLPQRFFQSIFGRKMLSIHMNAQAEIAAMQGNTELARSLRLQLVDKLGERWRQSHPVVRFELMKAYIKTANQAAALEIAKNLKAIGFARTDFLNAIAELDQHTQNQIASAGKS